MVVAQACLMRPPRGCELVALRKGVPVQQWDRGPQFSSIASGFITGAPSAPPAASCCAPMHSPIPLGSHRGTRTGACKPEDCASHCASLSPFTSDGCECCAPHKGCVGWSAATRRPALIAALGEQPDQAPWLGARSRGGADGHPPLALRDALRRLPHVPPGAPRAARTLAKP